MNYVYSVRYRVYIYSMYVELYTYKHNDKVFYSVLQNIDLLLHSRWRDSVKLYARWIVCARYARCWICLCDGDFRSTAYHFQTWCTQIHTHTHTRYDVYMCFKSSHSAGKLKPILNTATK